MPTLPTFATWLKQLRIERGLTQAQLAAAAGCSLSLIRKYETDVRRPTRAVTLCLAAALQLSDAEQSQFVHLALNSVASRQGTPTAISHPGWLPAPPTPLLGREQALNQLVDLCIQAPGRLVTLIGPPGVGKSRLALACASVLAEHFADGAWFVDLTPLNNTQKLTTAIANRLELACGDDIAMLMSALCQRHLLLVLDNMEHLLAAAPFVAQLLREVPRLTILVTSRVPLRIRAEHCFTVEPLVLPRTATIAAVAAAPASLLFCERAAAIAPGFQLSMENAATIAALCRRLDGLPLAIELVAAHSDQFRPDALLTQINHRLSDLEARLVDLPPHQQTLPAMIAWSIQLLPSAAHRSFRVLGVFAGSFDASLAAKVGATHLDLLVEHQLVQKHGAERYQLLETLWAYAAECLADDPAAAEVWRAHAHALADLAEEHGQQLNTPRHAEALALLNEYLPNIRSAIHWSFAHDGGIIAARITIALRFYWVNAGATQEGRQIEQFLQETAGDGLPPALLAKTYLTLGYLASQQADGVCISLLDRGVALAVQHQITVEIPPARYLQALLARYPGNLERCRTLLSEAIAAARAVGDDYYLAAALNELGMAYRDNSEPQQALAMYDEALVVAVRLGHATIVRRYESDRAAVLAELGDVHQARQIFERICADQENQHDHSARWETELRLARLEMEEGALDRAASLLKRAAAAVASMNIHYGLTMVLCRQGQLALLRTEYVEAQRLLKTAYDRAVSSMFFEEIAAALVGLALIESTTEPVQAARLCGAFEGLCTRFPLRVDSLTANMHRQVRRTLTVSEAELADAASHVVMERIRQTAFPDNYTALAAFQLDRVLAAALRAR
jgi:predicted ATPase/transcriptional regulator with XRE-family HTH domain